MQLKFDKNLAKAKLRMMRLGLVMTQIEVENKLDVRRGFLNDFESQCKIKLSIELLINLCAIYNYSYVLLISECIEKKDNL